MADHGKSDRNGGEQRPEPDLGEPSQDDAPPSAATDSEHSQSPTDAINAVRGLVEQVLEEGLSRVKGESGKLGSRASQTMGGILSELGVAQRRNHEDLELRIAQLEHRVRLLEGQDDASGEVASTTADAAVDDSGAAESPAEDS